jgi:protein SCO1
MSRNHVVIAFIAIVAALAGVLLARGTLGHRPPPQAAMTAGTLLQPPRALPELTLVDHVEQPFTRDRLHNRWTLLFFGFTNCPDICPTTLGVLAQMEKMLQDLPAAKRPQIVLVSVDTQRDTPQQLASYVKFYSPSFTGVTGSKQAIEDLTQAMHVPVAISTSANGAYTVDHSATIFLLDPSASLHALFSMPHEPDKIVADYRRIVAR